MLRRSSRLQPVQCQPSCAAARALKGVFTMFRSVPSCLPMLSRAGSALSALIGGAALAAFMTMAGPAFAQAPSAPAAKPATPKQASAAKDTSAAKSSKRPPKKAVEPQPEPEVELTAADEQQLAAAKEVLLGESG